MTAIAATALAGKFDLTPGNGVALPGLQPAIHPHGLHSCGGGIDRPAFAGCLSFTIERSLQFRGHRRNHRQILLKPTHPGKRTHRAFAWRDERSRPGRNRGRLRVRWQTQTPACLSTMSDVLTPFDDAATVAGVVASTQRWIETCGDRPQPLPVCQGRLRQAADSLRGHRGDDGGGIARGTGARNRGVGTGGSRGGRHDFADPSPGDDRFHRLSLFLARGRRRDQDPRAGRQLQIASFHPAYEFAGSAPDDIANCTNRSPHPTLHLLREASIDRAVAAFPDAAVIYERNIARRCAVSDTRAGVVVLSDPGLRRGYMLRRYCPPTSNSALVIWPSEQTRTVFISSAKTLPLSITPASAARAPPALAFACRSWKSARRCELRLLFLVGRAASSIFCGASSACGLRNVLTPTIG